MWIYYYAKRRSKNFPLTSSKFQCGSIITIFKEDQFSIINFSKFQCGSIITVVVSFQLHSVVYPLNSNVDLLLPSPSSLPEPSGLPLNSNVDLLLPIHSQYSKNKHFSTPICRPAKITACFITITFNHADNFYISRLYSAYCRPPGVFTL